MKPTDRELIEGAAKALGHSGSYLKSDGFWFDSLESMSDAFDLMYKLEIQPEFYFESIGAMFGDYRYILPVPISEDQPKDVAFKRAITTAAYYIWKESQK